MRKYVNKTLNVKRLLTLGDLDIRKIAAQDELLHADEYFGKVEQFLERAPEYAALITQASDPDRLEDIGKVLIEIGYDKLEMDMNLICAALRDGDLPQAKKWASEATSKFHVFFERTNSTRMPKKKFTAAIHPEEEEDHGVSLCNALTYLDYEEAHRKLRVLVVDDITVVLHTITAALSKHYEVFALTKSSQVESFLMHTTPELFLLDIEMPDTHGYDLVPVIRRFEEHQNTPIIFLTGNASLENLKTAVSLGACDFIAKPINQDILIEKIQSKIVRKKSF